MLSMPERSLWVSVFHRELVPPLECSLLVCQIRDFPALLREFADTLRPGGMLLLGDGEMQLYDEQRQPLQYTEQDASWVQRIFFAAYNAMRNRGGCMDSNYMSPTWLRSVESLTDVGWDKVFVPIGPWIYGEKDSTAWSPTIWSLITRSVANDKERVLAEMLRANTLAFISTLGPLLLRHAHPFFPRGC